MVRAIISFPRRPRGKRQDAKKGELTKRQQSVGLISSMLLVAFSTIDRFPFGGLKRNFALFAAVGANSFVHRSGASESTPFETHPLLTSFSSWLYTGSNRELESTVYHRQTDTQLVDKAFTSGTPSLSGDAVSTHMPQ